MLGELGRIAAAYLSFFSSLVEQPPWPSQVFLPLHPLSPVLQPPWPLHSFLPLQSCLPLSFSSAASALAPALESIATFLADAPLDTGTVAARLRAAEPASSPVIAAAAIINLVDYITVPFCEPGSRGCETGDSI